MLTLTFSCIKTAEQVEREKRIETMSEQMKDSQGLVADMVDDLKELKNQINRHFFKNRLFKVISY